MGLLDSFASPSSGGVLAGDYVPDAAAGYGTMPGSLQPGGMFTNPNTMALLGAAGALLSRPQYSRMPGEYGSPIGSALLGAMQGARGAYANDLTAAQAQQEANQAALSGMTVEGYRRMQQAYGMPGTAAGTMGAAMNGAAPGAPIPSYGDFKDSYRPAQILNGFHNGLFSGLAQLFGGASNSAPAAYAGLLAANAQAQEAQNQAALGGMTVSGYRQMQQATAGNPPTVGGANGAAMGALAAPAPQNLLVDPNAVPGGTNSSFSGATPGVVSAAATAPVANGRVPLLGGDISAAGSGGGVPARLPMTATNAGGSGAPPLFNVAALRNQYLAAASTPGMGAVAAQILQEINKNVPPGMQMLSDGTVALMPGVAPSMQMAEYAKAFGTGQGQAQWAGAIKGAEARAQYPYQLALETNKPYLLRGPGSTLVQNGHVIAQVPFDVRGVDPTGAGYQQFQFMPVSPNATGGPASASPGGGASVGRFGVGGGMTGGVVPTGGLLASASSASPGSNASPGSAATPRIQTSLSPLQSSSQEAQGKQLEDYGAALQSNATNAVNQQFIIDQMRRESGNGAGWLPGRFADWKGEFYGLLNGALPKDMAPSVDAALANYQSFQKNAMQLTTAATRQVSPRAAVQEMQMIREAMPGSKTSNGGLGYIFDQLSANNDFQIAKAQAADAWRPQHGGTLNGFESDWNKNVSPFAFLAIRMSKPDLAVMQKNLDQTPQGKALVNRIFAEVQYGQANGLFGNRAQ